VKHECNAVLHLILFPFKIGWCQFQLRNIVFFEGCCVSGCLTFVLPLLAPTLFAVSIVSWAGSGCWVLGLNGELLKFRRKGDETPSRNSLWWYGENGGVGTLKKEGLCCGGVAQIKPEWKLNDAWNYFPSFLTFLPAVFVVVGKFSTTPLNFPSRSFAFLRL